MSNTELVIGFIGTGIMGAPMSGHLAQAGYRVLLHDRDPAKARSASAAAGPNAQVAPHLHELAREADIVVTMLPDGAAVQSVVLGPEGVASHLRTGTLLLDCSSAQPWLTEETAQALQARGVAMVDAPVSGAAWGAAAAELVFMVGGEADAVQRVRPLLERMGRSVHHLGPLGSGHAMKCLNNCVTSMTFLATTEALVAGKRYGLDPAAMVDVLNESTGGSWITRTHYHQRVFNRSFDDPFKLELMLKDIGIAVDLAGRCESPMALSALGHELWRMAHHCAGTGASVSELVRWVESLSGTALTPGSSPRART